MKFEDFEERYVDEKPYYVFTDGEVQVCLEKCMSGFCVGVYDGNDYILAEKQCTNMPQATKQEQRDRAVELANVLYEQWKAKNVID